MHDVMMVDTPFDFEVIGEHRQDAFKLLARGGDGRYYVLDLRDSQVLPTEPTADWVLDRPVLPNGPRYLATPT